MYNKKNKLAELIITTFTDAQLMLQIGENNAISKQIALEEKHKLNDKAMAIQTHMVYERKSTPTVGLP